MKKKVISKKTLSEIERLSVHDHVCLLYETGEDQFASIIPYIRAGLERNEKCVYIADDNPRDIVLDAIGRGGLDIDAALRSGAFQILCKEDTYLQNGFFNPDLMIDLIGEAARCAEAEGYTALRATGEMTWLLHGDPGVERFAEYEAKLNYFFPEHNALGLCQYNLKRFSPDVILDVLRTHPAVIYKGFVCNNFYYVPSNELFSPDRKSMEVERLLGNIMERERLEEMRAVKEELQRSAAEFREAQRVAQVGSWDWDAETDTVTWSEETYSIFGWFPGMEPPKYRDQLALYTPESVVRLTAALENALKTGNPYELDLDLAQSKKSVIARGQAKRDWKGQITGLRGTVIDITERKKTEDELKRINAELQEALGKVKQLSGLLPICASCKRIRSEKDSWVGLEKYIERHSEAAFSHSICPECSDKLYSKELKAG